MTTNDFWNVILHNLITNPRDLPTRPKDSRTPKWFYAYVDGNSIYVANAKNHSNSSSISVPRRLNFSEFEAIYPIHLRRENGERVSQEATDTTRNQVYWYSIIHNCII